MLLCENLVFNNTPDATDDMLERTARSRACLDAKKNGKSRQFMFLAGEESSYYILLPLLNVILFSRPASALQVLDLKGTVASMSVAKASVGAIPPYDGPNYGSCLISDSKSDL
jgi:hypothetical protein